MTIILYGREKPHELASAGNIPCSAAPAHDMKNHISVESYLLGGFERMKKFSIKRFSWQDACIVFFSFPICDVMLWFLAVGADQEGWWEWLFGVPFWIINFPGFPFIYCLRDSADGKDILIALLASLSFSALIWSVAAGYFFGHKNAAKQTNECVA